MAHTKNSPKRNFCPASRRPVRSARSVRRSWKIWWKKSWTKSQTDTSAKFPAKPSANSSWKACGKLTTSRTSGTPACIAGSRRRRISSTKSKNWRQSNDSPWLGLSALRDAQRRKRPDLRRNDHDRIDRRTQRLFRFALRPARRKRRLSLLQTRPWTAHRHHGRIRRRARIRLARFRRPCARAGENSRPAGRDRIGFAATGQRIRPWLRTVFLSAIARRNAPAPPEIAGRAAFARIAGLRQTPDRRATLDPSQPDFTRPDRGIYPRKSPRRTAARRLRAGGRINFRREFRQLTRMKTPSQTIKK